VKDICPWMSKPLGRGNGLANVALPRFANGFILKKTLTTGSAVLEWFQRLTDWSDGLPCLKVPAFEEID
jgi:hypothetical protein